MEKIGNGFNLSEEQMNAAEKEAVLGIIWKPEKENESMFLKYVGSKPIEFLEENGKIPNLLQFENSDGESVNMWEKEVLKNQFETLGVSKGDVLFIKYLGKKKGKNSPQPYNNFSVVKVQ